ncbi:MAG: phosphoribosylglycinamide formyltransferase [Planctomycetota bacterium]
MTLPREPFDRPIRLGVLLSGGGSTLMNLLERIDAGSLPAEVATVVASRQCRGIGRAEAAGLEGHIVPYRDMPDRDAYSAAIIEHLDAAEVDLVCMAGFLSLWTIPRRYEGRVMNIHPALLPSFGGRGMHGRRVHQAVLDHGCKVSGCTVHLADNSYDTGPILVQKCVPVREDDTPETLAGRVFDAECEAYPEAIELFAAGRVVLEGRRIRITTG